MSIHDQVFQLMQAMAEQYQQMGLELELPPNSIKTNDALYVHYNEHSLGAEFTFKEQFTNPLKMYQGGFLCAAIDDVFGPLTYMIAKKPVVTVQMNTTFIRSFTAKDKTITFLAQLVSQSKSLIVLSAEVKTSSGKLIATATSQSFVLGEKQ